MSQEHIIGIEFLCFVALVIMIRLAELWVAKRNEKWLKGQGAIEFGKKHYPYIVALHTLFILAIIIEFVFQPAHQFYPVFFLIFVLLVLGKVWVIASLGRYWNTKILRVPSSAFVKKGPYKYFKHPNYFIVVCELAVIPMVFGLYWTAIVFTLLNGVMLSIRIREEERVWKE